MAIDGARFLDLLRAAKIRAARYVGIGGLGTNPTNPWCQHPGRPPLQKTEKAEPATKNTAVELVHHCFVCGLDLTHEIRGEESS
jgi:hypothetical protein